MSGEKLATTKGGELDFKILQVLIIWPRSTVNHSNDGFRYNLQSLANFSRGCFSFPKALVNLLEFCD